MITRSKSAQPKIFTVYDDNRKSYYGIISTIRNLIKYGYLYNSDADPDKYFFLPDKNNPDLACLSCLSQSFNGALIYVKEYDNNLKMKKEQENNMFKQYKIFPNIKGLGWIVYRNSDNKEVYTTDNYMDALIYVYNLTK